MHLKNILPTALAVAAVYAQEDSDSGSTNLTALLSGTDTLSSLNDLIGNFPDLATTLAGLEGVTILAPSNDALESLMSNSSSSSSMLSDEEFVSALLRYHVINGTVYASNITESPLFPSTYLNDSTYSNVTGGQVVQAVMNDDDEVEIVSGLKTRSMVSQANVNYTNGVVHIIDQVLDIPGNLTSTLVNANLTALYGAVANASLASTLAGSEDLTIFAPSNAAFQDISSALANASMDDLASILQYHVVEGTVAYSSELSNTSLQTLGGENVTITIEDGNVFVNSAQVQNADIFFAGGVIHVIDQVLNPNNMTNATSTDDEDSEDGDNAFGATSSGTVVPFTSLVTETATTVITDLVTSTSQVLGTVTPTGGAGSDSADSDSDSDTSTSEDFAALTKPTGVIGAAALFGGAAMLAF